MSTSSTGVNAPVATRRFRAFDVPGLTRVGVRGVPVFPDLAEGQDAWTALRVVGRHRAAKRIVRRADDTGPEVQPYDAGWRFVPSCRVVNLSPEGLLAFVEDAGRDPHTLYVRGTFHGGATDAWGCVRRLKAPEPGWSAHLVDRAHRANMLDLDGIELPSELNGSLLENGPEAFTHVAARLPWLWSRLSYVVSVSSSGGIVAPHLAKLHPWVITDRPVSSPEWRRILTALRVASGLGKAVDVSVADEIQPHYLSAPVLTGFADDPVRLRHWVHRGDVPELPVTEALAWADDVLTDAGAVALPLREAAELALTAENQGGMEEEAARPVTCLQNGSLSLGEAIGPVPFGSNAVRNRYQAILDDTVRIRMMLWGDAPIPRGSRTPMLFAALLCAANLDPERYMTGRDEAARRLGIDPVQRRRWIDQVDVAIRNRVARHLAGERVDYRGQERSPIYGPSDRWFIGWFARIGLTAGIRRMLDQLADESTKRGRRRWRRGARPLATARAARRIQAAERTARVMELSALGMSVRQIAAAVGLSPDYVKVIRRKHRGGVMECPPSEITRRGEEETLSGKGESSLPLCVPRANETAPATSDAPPVGTDTSVTATPAALVDELLEGWAVAAILDPNDDHPVDDFLSQLPAVDRTHRRQPGDPGWRPSARLRAVLPPDIAESLDAEARQHWRGRKRQKGPSGGKSGAE